MKTTIFSAIVLLCLCPCGLSAQTDPHIYSAIDYPLGQPAQVTVSQLYVSGWVFQSTTGQQPNVLTVLVQRPGIMRDALLPIATTVVWGRGYRPDVLAVFRPFFAVLASPYLGYRIAFPQGFPVGLANIFLFWQDIAGTKVEVVSVSVFPDELR